jgi:hypothetical protein
MQLGRRLDRAQIGIETILGDHASFRPTKNQAFVALVTELLISRYQRLTQCQEVKGCHEGTQQF